MRDVARKILFIMPTLGGGGAEKVIYNLIKLIPSKIAKSSLFLYQDMGHLAQDLGSQVSLKVKKHSRLFNALPSISSNFKQDYDTYFASGYHNLMVALIAYILGKSERLILRETSVVSSEKRRWKNLWLQRMIVPVVYSRCGVVIFQSEYGKTDFEDFYNFKMKNSVILHNPAQKFESEILLGTNIFLVGRLDQGKNISAALKLINQTNLKSIKIEIFGDGPEKNNLQSLAQSLGLDVVFHGYVSNMDLHWPRAKIHVMTSLFESMPNVVIEAAIRGIPSVCIEAPGGLNELYKMGNWGSLADSPEIFSKEIVRVFDWSKENRISMKVQAEDIFCRQAIENYIKIFSNT